MRIQLTIETSYLPTWGVAEGLRELVQNWLDAADAVWTPGEISYNAKTETLRLVNPEADLKRDALLLGVTSKAGDSSQRGQFGEGLKLGTLALVREGRSVKVYTPRENWQACIAESEEFAGRDVLTFRCRRRPTISDDVTVEVSPVTPEEYEEMRKTFVHFQKPERSFKCGSGTIFFDPELKGEIFVKGIRVQNDEDLQYGYDLRHVETDRDRKMVASWELEYYTTQIIGLACQEEKLSAETVYDLLVHGRKDVKQTGYLGDKCREKVAKVFETRHPKAVPVETAEESMKVGHLGVYGVVVSEQMVKALKGHVETGKQVAERLSEAPKEVYPLDVLSEKDQDTLLWCCLQLDAVRDIQGEILDRVAIVDFYDATLAGNYSPDSKGIKIALWALANRMNALKVLVHEYAHEEGEDGEKSHVAAIEDLWADLARHWAPE